MKNRWAPVNYVLFGLTLIAILAAPAIGQQLEEQSANPVAPQESASRPKPTSSFGKSGYQWSSGAPSLFAASLSTPKPSVFASPAPEPLPFPQGSSSGDSWTFNLTPYIWFAGFDANDRILNQHVSVSAGFADIFDELNFGWMNTFEARKGRWGIGTDLMYMNLDNLEFPTPPPPPAFSSIRLSLGQFMLGPQVAFRVAESERGSFDVLAGFRYWHVNVKLRTSAGILPPANRETSENFVNPLIGGRFRVNLGKGWYVPVTGDIGGFGAGSDLAWHAFGGLGKDIKENVSLLVGYRAMGLDEKPIDELTFHGLVVGATFRWGR